MTSVVLVWDPTLRNTALMVIHYSSRSQWGIFLIALIIHIYSLISMLTIHSVYDSVSFMKAGVLLILFPHCP